MIQAYKLSKQFLASTLFSEATFTIAKGEICALVGRNGCGKTTLLKMMAGLETSDTGDLVFPKGYRIGYLKQHIAFSESSVVEELLLGAKLADNERYLAEMMLLGFGFTEKELEKPPHLFSGGMQLRIELAKVLLSDPDILLLDEPTNYLDIASIHYLKEFLQDWKKEAVIISHDRDFLDATCNVMLGIHREKILKVSGSTSDYYNLLIEREKQHEALRETTAKEQEKLQGFIDRFGAKASKAKQAKSKAKALQKLPRLDKLSSMLNLSFSFPFAPFPGKKMIEAKNLHFSYEPDSPIINSFSLEIHKGDRLAIIGANGKGKSTLLSLLAGQRAPLGGDVQLASNLEVGYFGQTNIQRLDPQLTIYQEISSTTPPISREKALSIAGVMQFSGLLAEKKIGNLSGGEKSRVLLGKILAKPCNILFLDEPTHHLDLESIEGLLNALEDFPGAIVMVTHSEYILQSFAFQKIIHCKQSSQQLHLGSYDEIHDKLVYENIETAAIEEQISQSHQDRLANKENLKLAKKIEKKEQEIQQKEVALEQFDLTLAQEKDPHKILTLAKKRKEMQKEIQILYDAYEALLCEQASLS